MNLNSIKVYCNDNESRTFISLAIANVNFNATRNLQYIVNQLNGCLSEFKLPPFYEVSTIRHQEHFIGILTQNRQGYQNLHKARHA